MPIFFENQDPLYTGAVLDDREENYHDDSDFYAVVWDDEAGVIKRVEYNTTRFAGGGSCTVDATDEVKAKANAYLVEWALNVLRDHDKADAAKPTKGKRVKVVRGRKVPLGTEGILFYMEDQVFSPRYHGGYRKGPDAVKVGIALSEDLEVNYEVVRRDGMTQVKTPFKSHDFRLAARDADGKWDSLNGVWEFPTSNEAAPLAVADRVFTRYKDVAWTYRRNLEVVEPERYQVPEEELRAKAERARGNWALPVSKLPLV